MDIQHANPPENGAEGQAADIEIHAREGLIGMVALPGMAPFEGAVPITVDGDVLGAVAVSGVTKEIDGEIAQVGADAVARILAE